MKLVHACILFSLIVVSSANEDMRPQFCDNTCVQVVPRPQPPKSVTPAEIKKANDAQERFRKCTNRCSDLYSYTDEKKNAKILDFIKKSNF